MIKKMTLADLPAVLAIENQVFSSPYNEANYAYEIEDSPVANLYVYMQDEKVIGYIDYWITFDSAQLCKVAVHPDKQHQGIGEQLMEYMFAHLDDEVEHVFLEVRNSNKNAISFYEKLGFIEIDVRKNYYKDPTEDARIMGVMLVGE
ncbi:hypothetical protein A4S06_11185 [Erysipelotrichaceae bacterium MTC7]|nr:hypothetical protein A4S06_11185 [Erysipelotrichaceae bacterium MTC7]